VTKSTAVDLGSISASSRVMFLYRSDSQVYCRHASCGDRMPVAGTLYTRQRLRAGPPACTLTVQACLHADTSKIIPISSDRNGKADDKLSYSVDPYYGISLQVFKTNVLLLMIS